MIQSCESDNAEVEGEAVAEDHRLGTVFGGDAAEVSGDRVERLVPPDLDPAGIGVALRPRPLQRTEEASWVVDDLRRDLALEAQCLAGRMLGVGIERHERPVGDGGHRAAARDAQCAEAGDALAVVIGHWARSFRSVGNPVKQDVPKTTAGSQPDRCRKMKLKRLSRRNACRGRSGDPASDTGPRWIADARRSSASGRQGEGRSTPASPEAFCRLSKTTAAENGACHSRPGQVSLSR